jgi:hypothetical protein
VESGTWPVHGYPKSGCALVGANLVSYDTLRYASTVDYQ